MQQQQRQPLVEARQMDRESEVAAAVAVVAAVAKDVLQTAEATRNIP